MPDHWQIWRDRSALTNELVVPLLDRPVVNKHVRPALNFDLELWRIDGRSPIDGPPSHQSNMRSPESMAQALHCG